jgi:prophage DNA circulation protein
MTNNNCASEVLKPFQSILDALANRKKHDELSVDCRNNMKMQAIRTRTTRPFRIWDRLRESLSNPENMCAEMQQMLAQNLTGSHPAITRNEELETKSFTDLPAVPAKSAAALARAKTTSTRLKSLEVYLESAQVANKSS